MIIVTLIKLLLYEIPARLLAQSVVRERNSRVFKLVTSHENTLKASGFQNLMIGLKHSRTIKYANDFDHSLKVKNDVLIK